MKRKVERFTHFHAIFPVVAMKKCTCISRFACFSRLPQTLSATALLRIGTEIASEGLFFHLEPEKTAPVRFMTASVILGLHRHTLWSSR